MHIKIIRTQTSGLQTHGCFSSLKKQQSLWTTYSLLGSNTCAIFVLPTHCLLVCVFLCVGRVHSIHKTFLRTPSVFMCIISVIDKNPYLIRLINIYECTWCTFSKSLRAGEWRISLINHFTSFKMQWKEYSEYKLSVSISEFPLGKNSKNLGHYGACSVQKISWPHIKDSLPWFVNLWSCFSNLFCHFS